MIWLNYFTPNSARFAETLTFPDSARLSNRMKPNRILLVLSAAAIGFCHVPSAPGQGSPNIVWEALTPNSLANNIQGVGWSPSASGGVTVGSSDRWVRTRKSDDGLLLYSVLQPIRSGTADQ